MAKESRVCRLPAGMSTQVVANAVSSFLSSAKGMEVQSAETTEGYVVQGRQEKDGWKTIAGMRMATTVQMIRMDDNLNVTVGQGEWSDKIGAGALGWVSAWPLAGAGGGGGGGAADPVKRKGDDGALEIDLVFKIAAIGISVAVLNQLLIRSGREEQAMMTTLAGLVVVLSMLVQQISDLFVTIKALFAL